MTLPVSFAVSVVAAVVVWIAGTRLSDPVAAVVAYAGGPVPLCMLRV